MEGQQGGGQPLRAVSGVGTVTKLCKLARAGQGVQQQESCAAQARRARGAPRRGDTESKILLQLSFFLEMPVLCCRIRPAPDCRVAPPEPGYARAHAQAERVVVARLWVCVMQAVAVCIWAHSSQAGAKRAGRTCHGSVGHSGAA